MDIELQNRMSENEQSNGFDGSDVTLNVRRPKRILHFSDGTLEEFSDNEGDEVDQSKMEVIVDESQMTWPSWMIHKANQTKDTVVAGCEYVGEALASFLGITTSKFDLEYEEYKRREEEKALEEEAQESQGWHVNEENVTPVVQKY